MSSSIAIPKPRGPRSGYGASSSSGTSSSSTPGSADSTPSSYTTSDSASTPQTPSTASSTMAPPTVSSAGSMDKGKSRQSERRPSLLGSSLSHSEYTVINIAGPDRPPRLVTCVKSSQGFDWNQEIFLPSYIDYDSSELELKPDPVMDIILTDEEAEALLP